MSDGFLTLHVRVEVEKETDPVYPSFARHIDHLKCAFAKFEAKMDARFDKVDARFDKVDARFDRLERKLDDFIKKQGEANVLMERRLNRLE